MKSTTAATLIAAITILTLLVTPVAVFASPISQGGTVHTVRKGDTLSAIASRYGTSVGAIRSANRLSGDTSEPGQRLTIRAGGSQSTWSRSSSGTTSSQITTFSSPSSS